MTNLTRLVLLIACVLALAGCSATDILQGGTSAPTQTPVPTRPPIKYDVAITAIVNSNYAEHVVIQNQDTRVADISGWQLVEKDNAIMPFIFPDGFTLAPGAEVRVYSGRDGRQNNPPEALEWTEKNVWDNNGDTAKLLMAQGDLVSTFKYP